MADEGASPSAGWRAVYEAMDVSPAVEPADEALERCPGCVACSVALADDARHCPVACNECPAEE